jgi:hypothetical protein
LSPANDGDDSADNKGKSQGVENEELRGGGRGIVEAYQLAFLLKRAYQLAFLLIRVNSYQ